MNSINLKRFFTSYQFHYSTRIFGIALLLYAALITSWVSDDAQITFRSILNFISGLGITFNYGERVQVFTHPLWFFVLSGVIAVTKELFITTQIVSIIISILAIIILTKIELKLGQNNLIIVSPIVFLAFSQAFGDYMTSGLENPLSYLLISLLFYFIFTTNIEKNLKYIFVILALIVQNRLDIGLIFVPLTLVLMYTYLNRKNFINILWIGTLILFSWFSFATFYFGSPFPNTFYAKLNADFPMNEVYSRGFDYFVSLFLDFNSIIILVLGFCSLIFYRNRIIWTLSIGKILYLFYILHIGGDFMQGRFFSVLVFISIGEFIFTIYKSDKPKQYKNKFVSLVLVLIICCSIPLNAPIYYNMDYSPRHFYKSIVDERGVYYQVTGLFASDRKDWPRITYLDKKTQPNYKVNCENLWIRYEYTDLQFKNSYRFMWFG